MKITLLIVLLLPTLAFTQTSNFEFKIIDSVKASKDQLYMWSKKWIANSFNSSKAVIEMDDKASGVIIGKGVFLFDKDNKGYSTHFSPRYSFEITVKDNKYRLKLYDFINEGYSQNSYSRSQDKLNGSGLSFNDTTFQQFGYAKRDLIPAVKQFSDGLMLSFNESMKKQLEKEDF